MMTRPLLFIALVIAVILVWLSTQSHDESVPTEPSPTPLTVQPKRPQSPQIPQQRLIDTIPNLVDRTEIPHQLEKRVNRYTNGTVDLVAAITRSQDLFSTPYTEDDLTVIQDLLHHYRFLFKTNPVGSENAEFTAALLGANSMKAVFIDPSSSALSSEYELLDRWGTPLFFHPNSATSLDLTSAGPDRKLWTSDDITTAP